MAEVRIAVVGASGYGGAEIVRLATTHPCAKVVKVTSARSAGRPLRELCPWLATELVLEPFDPETLHVDVVFLCQESGFAMHHAATLMNHGCRVIDLSADFRLRDPEAYRTYYKAEPAPDLGAVYGLPELSDRSQIEAANLVANPGCYPTASLLGLMPLVRAGIVSGVPVIDAKSGVSGAGRSKAETDYLFSELDNGFKGYALRGHRHIPEIEQMAGCVVRFSPHLVSMPRGLLSTLHVPLKETANVKEIFAEFYANEPFVTMQDAPPSTKQVTGSNRCAISAEYDERTRMAVVTSVIDNLGKGAAGQAIQNMNLMFQLPETTGLPLHGVWP